jgi:EAL domain-containing protein (putative c-di-GMP-specific phosphodiesterase class I)
VDNFGLHHSAFEYLQKLKPSYVKLSPSYLTELKGNLENQFFISSVVKITHSLDIKVIALGVEDDTILELLQQLGVDGYQGYITGKLTELN